MGRSQIKESSLHMRPYQQRKPSGQPTLSMSSVADAVVPYCCKDIPMQGYLAHKKQRPPRTLQQGDA